jgi:DNA-binding transcriptional ArsR family regulator
MSIDLDRTGEAPAAIRALAEPFRWRIVELLAREQLCVCHLTEELGISQPLVSHHLRVLRDAGLIAGERFRYWTYYRLVPDAMAGLATDLAGLAAAAPIGEGDRRPCC